MTRGGQNKKCDNGAMRRCIATGAVQPKHRLIRFVVTPDGDIAPDLLEKLPGRGIWISADPEAFEKAIKRNLFARAAKTRAIAASDLTEKVETGLVWQVTHLIALARKAGQAVAGFEKVKDWLASDRAVILFQAMDGSQRGKSKLRPPQSARYFNVLTSAELGLAFGRHSVIHSALAAGGLAHRVVEGAMKLQGLRAIDASGGQAAGKDENRV